MTFHKGQLVEINDPDDGYRRRLARVQHVTHFEAGDVLTVLVDGARYPVTLRAEAVCA